mmetsp:Transcript_37064/g.42292  ORF Transcript_37064/g.42292 Transcript_37064/m.42292 type:complete len:185 (+) Transcript_37064:173-727(+)|eukprot:CAMPEP_0194151320 /NCGR_PEP_ID=MMETSP0152-20130528/47627_1 /TAXON_ID=1049557 /ORGANISM="Thalassiothrix antarctica, Strain L6-D1" /LENGTH=184 /DNA_ID=CAMNT_0038855027 /DNA_START=32 /DNA_END=586 /DNA_ORIENTATION=+
MVVYVLHVKAELEGNIASVAIQPRSDICISVRNPCSIDEVREEIIIDSSALEEPHEDRDGHNEAPCHFALKWKGHKERSTIRVLWKGETEEKKRAGSVKGGHKQKVEDTILTREMTASDSGEYVPMLAFECKGIEPFAFHPNELLVTEKDGKQHDKIDVSSGAGQKFDLATGIIAIRKIETKFV